MADVKAGSNAGIALQAVAAEAGQGGLFAGELQAKSHGMHVTFKVRRTAMVLLCSRQCCAAESLPACHRALSHWGAVLALIDVRCTLKVDACHYGWVHSWAGLFKTLFSSVAVIAWHVITLCMPCYYAPAILARVIQC